ncbi:MAG: sigma-54-dependent transcriptional regulator [Anaerolineae bacterium]|jgi:DNA-binding NtrC family response regulator|nr:sigma-54-dependent Fis family transcriptional regulator [Ardenticatenia bacterium]MBK8539579.1 sigma-54-dependent Fis family transcriptional regulator [Ardenticatenia bacterium]HQZ70531.1 sigma-54 dependent transcriptional regulator [Anaerolineae bacterium]HRA18900.1 sigma-54 dependent transcriptional regulator [Anaerolineae bacterium]
MTTPTVLVAEDNALTRDFMVRSLRANGYDVLEADGLAAARRLVESRVFDLAFIDLCLGDGDGRDLLDQLRELAPEVPVIVATSTDTAASAVELIRRGAYDYMVKPVPPSDLLRMAARGVELSRARRAINALHDARLRESSGWDIGETTRMRQTEHTVKRFAPTDAGILIQGESGTGKEAVARALHDCSERAKGPFIAINCAAVPAQLLESEVFGHEKGSFTGAVDRRKGMLELAHGGTLFLDEVATMSLEMQAKLLRALQEFTFRRVGGQLELSVNVRVVSATNRSLREAIEKGEFRDDLYYRLCVMTVDLPPLRERVVDIPFFIQKFIGELRAKTGSSVTGITETALWAMCRYSWPGNIRQLRNTVERAMIFATGEERIDLPHLPAELLNANQDEERSASAAGMSPAPKAAPQLADTPADGPSLVLPGAIPASGFDMKATIAQWERDWVSQALSRTAGNQSAAARLLGLTRDELRYRVDKFVMEPAV